jgi:hypothetical protein
MFTFIFAILLLSSLFIVGQWIAVFTMVIYKDNLIKTKKDFILWLIPLYMPIKTAYKTVKSHFDKLE